MENYRKVLSQTMPDMAHRLASDAGFSTNALLLLTKARLRAMHRVLALPTDYDGEEESASKENGAQNKSRNKYQSMKAGGSAEGYAHILERFSEAEAMQAQLDAQ